MGPVTWGLVMVVAAPTLMPGIPAAGDRPVALTIKSSDMPTAKEVEAFLCQRAHETFAVTCNEAPAPTAWVFDATLTWLSVDRVLVQVQDAAGVLVSRTVEVTDPGAAKLTLWLLLRATMNRALIEPGRVLDLGASAKPMPLPSEPELPSASPAALASLPGTAEADETPPGSATPARDEPGPGYSVFGAALVDGARLFALGASFAACYRPWRDLFLEVELGYRLAPGVVTSPGEVGLIIHHVPLGVSLGWELGDDARLVAGWFASADLKVPVTAHERALAVGVDTGALIETRLPLTRPSAQLLVRGTAGFRPVRQRYVVDDGTVTERSWVFGLGAGVSWP